MTVALAGLATFVLPSQAMANLVTYETGLYTARDLLRVGLLLTLVFLVILATVTVLWWERIGFFGMSFLKRSKLICNGTDREGEMTIKIGWQGRFFENFEVGDVYEYPLGRTVTTTDNIWFTLLTQNTAPIHFDHHYSAQTKFGKPLVDSTFTLALVTGQSVTEVSRNAMANLALDDIKLSAPVFERDTIYSRSEVLEERESKSRPNVGIVTVKTTGYNQDGTVVVTFKRTVMVYRRGHSPNTCRLTPKETE